LLDGMPKRSRCTMTVREAVPSPTYQHPPNRPWNGRRWPHPKTPSNPTISRAPNCPNSSAPTCQPPTDSSSGAHRFWVVVVGQLVGAVVQAVALRSSSSPLQRDARRLASPPSPGSLASTRPLVSLAAAGALATLSAGATSPACGPEESAARTHVGWPLPSRGSPRSSFGALCRASSAAGTPRCKPAFRYGSTHEPKPLRSIITRKLYWGNVMHHTNVHVYNSVNSKLN
jgi:hypothetical protein